MLLKSEISVGLMGHLAFMQTLPLPLSAQCLDTLQGWSIVEEFNLGAVTKQSRGRDVVLCTSYVRRSLLI